MPVPIPWVSLLYALAVLIPVWTVANLFGVPYANVGLTLRFVVPFAVAAYFVRLSATGQRPLEVILSWTRLAWFLARNREPVRQPTRLRSAPVNRLAPVPQRLRSHAKGGRRR